MKNENKTQEQLAKIAKREYMRNYMKNYREKNRAKIRAGHKKWQQENPEKVREYQEKHWANKARESLGPKG